MIRDFEEIKEKFIVDEAEYPKEKIAELMEIMLKYLRVSKGGQVVIIKSVPGRKTLQLILSARLIASKVDEAIGQEISREELLNYSYLSKDVFRTRFNELLKDGFAEKKGDNIKAKNILLVERFLKNLKSTSVEREMTKKPSLKKSKKSKINSIHGNNKSQVDVDTAYEMLAKFLNRKKDKIKEIIPIRDDGSFKFDKKFEGSKYAKQQECILLSAYVFFFGFNLPSFYSNEISKICKDSYIDPSGLKDAFKNLKKQGLISKESANSKKNILKEDGKKKAATLLKKIIPTEESEKDEKSK